MKKFFSAFLLMAMMVASVGSFVSCSDIEDAIAKVETSANNNATAIESLKSEVAALKTAVSAAQSAADAAMAAAKDAAAAAKAAQATGDAAAAAAATAQAEAEAAKAAAAQAKADAIAAAVAEVEALETEINAAMEAMKTANAAEMETIKAEVAKLQAEAATQVEAIKKLNDSIEGHAARLDVIEKTLENYKAILAELELLTAENAAKIEKNIEDIKALQDKVAEIEAKHAADITDIKAQILALQAADATAAENNAKAIEDLKAELAALEAEVDEKIAALDLDKVLDEVAKINSALVALQNRLQSVSYVPEWANGPKAVFFAEENEDYGYVHMSFEVAPKEYAANITAENTKLVGVPVKGIEVEEHDVKILSADPETGIVEVLAYIAKDSEIWIKKPATDLTAPNAALALRVVAEDAQVTSAYTMVQAIYDEKSTIANSVFFGVYNEDGDFVYKTKDDGTLTIEHKVAYNTAVAESEVALFEDLVARVFVEGFCDYISVEEAAEMFGFDITVTEVTSRYGKKFYTTTNNKVYKVAEGATAADTRAFVVANDETLDVTVKFNEAAVNYLNDEETALDLTDLMNRTAKVVLSKGYFEVNGNRPAKFVGITAEYGVKGLNEERTITVSPAEIAWTKENAEYVVAGTALVDKDLDVEGADARAIKVKAEDWKYVAVDENGEELSAEAKAKVDAVISKVDVKFISIDNADAYVTLAAWPEEETTYYYIFTGSHTDLETQKTVTYTYDFSVTVEAAPAGADVNITNQPGTITLVKSGVYVPQTEADTLNTYVPVTGIVEALLPTYVDFYETEKEAKKAIEDAITGTNGINVYVANDGIMPEDPTYTAAAEAVNYIYTPANATKGTPVVSKFAIPYDKDVYNAMKSKYVRFAFDVELYGIVSTIAADYTVGNWTYKATSPDQDKPFELVSVDTYSEVLRGTVPFTLEEETAYRYYKLNATTKEKEYAATKPATTGYFTEAAFNYWSFASAVESEYTFGENNITVGSTPVANAVNLMKYFKLVTKEGQTPDYNKYTLVVELITSVPENGIATAPKIAFARTGASLAYPVGTPLFEAKYDDNGKYAGNKSKFTISDFATSGHVAQLYLDWNGFKNNAVSVKVSLIKNYVVPAAGTQAPAGSNVDCGTRTINLTHADIVSVPATAPADAEIVVYYDDINATKTVELAKGIRVFAADGETPLYNLAATNWTDVFGAYTNSINGFAGKDDKTPAYSAGSCTSYFNTVYGLTANFVEIIKNEVPTGEYQYTCSDANFDDYVSFDAANGQLTITHDTTLNLNRDITVTIPVKIGHMFTYTGESTNVKVVIKPGHAPVE